MPKIHHSSSQDRLQSYTTEKQNQLKELYPDYYVANYISLSTKDKKDSADQTTSIVTLTLNVLTILPRADWLMIVANNQVQAAVPFDVFCSNPPKGVERLEKPLEHWRIPLDCVTRDQLANWAERFPAEGCVDKMMQQKKSSDT